MSKDVDAVIAALKAALQDAEARRFTVCKSRVANRWINQLPGAWTGKWRHLKIHSDFDGEIFRDDFIGQLRATIAYLETNKDAIASTPSFSFSSLFKHRNTVASEPLDAEFSEVPSRSWKQKTAPAPVKLVKND